MGTEVLQVVWAAFSLSVYSLKRSVLPKKGLCKPLYAINIGYYACPLHSQLHIAWHCSALDYRGLSSITLHYMASQHCVSNLMHDFDGTRLLHHDLDEQGTNNHVSMHAYMCIDAEARIQTAEENAL